MQSDKINIESKNIISIALSEVTDDERNLHKMMFDFCFCRNIYKN